MTSFIDYREEFERKVIIAGIEQNCLGKSERVSANSGRLSAKPFGDKMGVEVNTDIVCAIDYYGHIKKSNGFGNMMRGLRKRFFGKQIKFVRVIVVHFASIRLEKIAKLAPDLIAKFPKFKKEILDARGFVHNYEV